jgi:hypothetical protein
MKFEQTCVPNAYFGILCMSLVLTYTTDRDSDKNMLTNGETRPIRYAFVLLSCTNNTL